MNRDDVMTPGRQKKKLVLRRDLIKALVHEDLSRVVGGNTPPPDGGTPPIPL